MADRRARSRRGSRSASSPMSDLPDAEYEELANFHSKHELFDAIERGHSITLAAGAREKVAVTLLGYAERCFRRERRIAHEVESRLKIVTRSTVYYPSSIDSGRTLSRMRAAKVLKSSCWLRNGATAKKS